MANSVTRVLNINYLLLTFAETDSAQSRFATPNIHWCEHAVKPRDLMWKNLNYH